MKKYFYAFPILLAVVLALFLISFRKTPQNNNSPGTISEDSNQEIGQKKITASLANPASEYCEENGGELEIIRNNDGSQFGMCKFKDYSCEEWAYFNAECTIEEDTAKIEKALTEKGLNLTDMKVAVFKHLGKYIESGVIPVSVPAGGGYVFAVKEGDEIKILADGNGAIMCSSFEDYPEFPAYLVPECVDEAGNPISR